MLLSLYNNKKDVEEGGGLKKKKKKDVSLVTWTGFLGQATRRCSLDLHWVGPDFDLQLPARAHERDAYSHVYLCNS